MQNTENKDVSGIALLVAGAVVLSVVSFVLVNLGTILLLLLAAAGLWLLGVLLRALTRSLAERARAGLHGMLRSPAGTGGGSGARTAGRTTARNPGRSPRKSTGKSVAKTAEQARRTAAEDMRTAWIRWQLGVLPPQQRHGDASFIAARLAEIPHADWDAIRLRRHGQALWCVRDASARTPLHGEVEARLDRVAAMISELTDAEFDTHRGQTDDRYLYHPDREVRAAYLAGGSQGVEAIMGTITAVRAQVREDAAARAAADSLARERNAALRALRETRRPARPRDAHAAWEAQAEQIGR
ncbi:hypothetical protein [uncultured Kocuria sp.]|uniref:hypothetical protein n=1 Tax=uncultured Kocuria sp. TaxID=259305 RepID=UPI00261F8411|nr:hypothetical protein [uncultured Kocuria sp.]